MKLQLMYTCDKNSTFCRSVDSVLNFEILRSARLYRYHRRRNIIVITFLSIHQYCQLSRLWRVHRVLARWICSTSLHYGERVQLSTCLHRMTKRMGSRFNGPQLLMIPLDTSSAGSSSSSGSTSTTAPSGVIANAANVEIVFLEGSWSEALTLANRCLKQSQKDGFYDDVQTSWPLLTEVSLPPQLDNSHQTRYISCHFQDGGTKTTTAVDDKYDSNHESSRVAAIALQSWYELANLDPDFKLSATSSAFSTTKTSTRFCLVPESKEQVYPGAKFLQPFLDTYTSTTPGDVLGRRVMSIELLLVWIQFLLVTSKRLEDFGTRDSIVRLTMEVLRLVRVSTPCGVGGGIDIPGPIGQEVCGELVRLAFTLLLPKYSTAAATQLLLTNLQRKDNFLLIESFSDNASYSIPPGNQNESRNNSHRKTVVQQCLCFCNTDDGNWPVWLRDVFRDCRVQLQLQLKEINSTPKGPNSAAVARECQRNEGSRQNVLFAGKSSPSSSNSWKQLSIARTLSLWWARSYGSISLPWQDATDRATQILIPRLRQLHTLLIEYFSVVGPIKDSIVSSEDRTTMQRHQEQQLLLHTRRKRHIQILALMVCLLYGWRKHRRTLLRMGSSALSTAVWKATGSSEQ